MSIEIFVDAGIVDNVAFAENATKAKEGFSLHEDLGFSPLKVCVNRAIPKFAMDVAAPPLR